MDVLWSFGLAALVALGIAIVLLFSLWLSVKILRKKYVWLASAYEDIRPRIRFFVLTLALLISLSVVDLGHGTAWVLVTQVLTVLLILSGGFLVQASVNFAVLRVIDRFDAGDQTNAETRRISTQLRLIRRLANVTIGVLAVGFALFTFPEVQAVGAGVLASAGVLGVVGGLAAQSVLGNLFAGIQLAFSNAIRVGDVVVVDEEWGTVGEITLSYVVIYIWDERRLIVPSTHFTSKSFEMWTRQSSKLLGTVFMDVDWRVPLDAMREEFQSFLATNPLYDGRASGVSVTGAVGGYVQVRFLISADDSSNQWDLRCEVREHMVTWLQEHHPMALPVTRVTLNSLDSLDSLDAPAPPKNR